MNTVTTTIQAPFEARRRGHVARLPKPLPDLVNFMIDDGKPYSEIVDALEKSTNPKLPMRSRLQVAYCVCVTKSSLVAADSAFDGLVGNLCQKTQCVKGSDAISSRFGLSPVTLSHFTTLPSRL